MRQLAMFDDERAAMQLGDVLFASDIDNDVMQARDGTWAVWVHRDDQLDDARALATRLEQEPDAPDLQEQIKRAEDKRKALMTDKKRSRHKEVDLRTRFQQGGMSPTYVTWGLIGLCVMVAMLTSAGDKRALVEPLTIATLREAYQGRLLWSVQQGEVWRLLTPILLHFGWMHLLFNMWWLMDLGSAMERRHGSFYLMAVVGVSGVLSNLAQYLLTGNPMFGGMSGVVYALLGYIWIRGRFDPQAGLALHKHIVIFMLAWMGLGFIGLFRMANFAHLGGLLVGSAWGYLASGDLKRRLKG